MALCGAMGATSDREELLIPLVQAVQRELAGRLIARNNDLIWRVFCLAEGIEPDGSPRKQAGAGYEA